MATFVEGSYRSREAGVDHTNNQYKVVKLNAADKVVLAAAATDEIDGVLETVGKNGEPVSVAVVSGAGSFKVKLGGTVAKGAPLTSSASGLAVQATQTAAGAQPTTRVFGRAGAAGVSGDIIEYQKASFLY